MENVVFVGKKPLIQYVYSVIVQFTNGQKEVHVKARGRAISRAIDVVNVLKRRFMAGVKVKEIQIGSEEVEREGKKVNVSTIDIVLSQ